MSGSSSSWWLRSLNRNNNNNAYNVNNDGDWNNNNVNNTGVGLAPGSYGRRLYQTNDGDNT